MKGPGTNIYLEERICICAVSFFISGKKSKIEKNRIKKLRFFCDQIRKERIKGTLLTKWDVVNRMMETLTRQKNK